MPILKSGVFTRYVPGGPMPFVRKTASNSLDTNWGALSDLKENEKPKLVNMGANASMTLVLFLDITVATSKNRK